jgi:hypothetical protein
MITLSPNQSVKFLLLTKMRPFWIRPCVRLGKTTGFTPIQNCDMTNSVTRNCSAPLVWRDTSARQTRGLESGDGSIPIHSSASKHYYQWIISIPIYVYETPRWNELVVLQSSVRIRSAKSSLQGLDATRIHHELDAVHGPDAIPYPMGTQILRSAIWTQTDSETPHSEINNVIVQAFGQIPFASVKELARRLYCAPATVYRHLTGWVHFLFKHLEWVPHDFTTTQMVFQWRSQTSFFDSSCRSDATTQLCSSYWMSTGFTFSMTSNDGGFQATNPFPIAFEAWCNQKWREPLCGTSKASTL